VFSGDIDIDLWVAISADLIWTHIAFHTIRRIARHVCMDFVTRTGKFFLHDTTSTCIKIRDEFLATFIARFWHFFEIDKEEKFFISGDVRFFSLFFCEDETAV
jgi:hypothetical protein